VNADELRALLSGAAAPAWDDEVRASSALYEGHQLVQRRTRRRRVTGLAGAAVLGAAVLVALVPHTSTPTTDVVLGCSPGTGTSGAGLATGGVDGVTLAVRNTTHDVMAVTAGGTSVLALPGTSAVTLPLTAGTTSVRCGSGAPVRLTVQHLSRQSGCASVETALASRVESGDLDALTRSQVGALPAGATVDAPSAASPVRRVQVRASGRVVAEAVWHEMPAAGSWQLESISRCG
jgi:hypothetical protein